MTLHGFDVSNNQGGALNVKALPGDFVIMKATEGVSFNDRYFDSWISQAKAAGKLVGAYHFMNGRVDAKAQADHFTTVVKPYIGEALLALDVEQSSITPDDVTTCATRIHDNTGVWPIVYLSTSFHVKGYDAGIRDKCGLWIANWGGNMPTSTFKDNYTGQLQSGATLAIWQFTSRFQATAAYGGNLDADTAYMDAAGWKAYAQGGTSGTVAAQTETYEERITRLADETMLGKYGNGEARKKALGKDYYAVQGTINARLRPATTRKSNEEIADEVIRGKWGNGTDRRNRLTAAGYDPNAIQAIVNKKMKG